MFLKCRLSTRPVLTFVTVGAQGNQIQIVIRTLLAAQLLVVDPQVLPGTRELALPAVAAQHLFSELFEFGIRPPPIAHCWNQVFK